MNCLIGSLCLVVLLVATNIFFATFRATTTLASHSPTPSRYYYPICSRSHAGATLWGMNRAYFDAIDNQLESWRYNFTGPGLGNKNNNNLLDQEGGVISLYYASPDSLVSGATYLQLPFMYASSMNLGHQIDGRWWYQQSEFVFDVTGPDPSCFSVWIP